MGWICATRSLIMLDDPFGKLKEMVALFLKGTAHRFSSPSEATTYFENLFREQHMRIPHCLSELSFMYCKAQEVGGGGMHM